jgi:hypothetical protein
MAAGMEHDTKYAARLANVYFLRLLGTSLRRATADVPGRKMPEEISRLLRKLQCQEALQVHGADKAKEDPAA